MFCTIVIHCGFANKADLNCREQGSRQTQRVRGGEGLWQMACSTESKYYGINYSDVF